MLISAFYLHSAFPSKFIPPSQRQSSKSLLKQTDHREDYHHYARPSFQIPSLARNSALILLIYAFLVAQVVNLKTGGVIAIHAADSLTIWRCTWTK